MPQTSGTNRLRAQDSQCLVHCYFHPAKLPTLPAQLSTVQPSVPTSEQTANSECSGSQTQGLSVLRLGCAQMNDDFSNLLCWWETGAWAWQAPQGREDGRVLERPSLQRGGGGSATEFSIFLVSPIQGLEHSCVQLVFTKHLLCAGHGVRPWGYNEVHALTAQWGSAGKQKAMGHRWPI